MRKVMKFRFRKLIVFLMLWAATFNAGGSDSPMDISGTYKLTEVNGSKLPAVSWVGPDGKCKEEVLSATMIVDSESRWAALPEVRKSCADFSGNESASNTESVIFTGSYKVSGNKIEFYDETLDVTDSASLENDVLRYTAHGILKYEGQTTVFVFLRSK
jgi:hypothetical protein